MYEWASAQVDFVRNAEKIPAANRAVSHLWEYKRRSYPFPSMPTTVSGMNGRATFLERTTSEWRRSRRSTIPAISSTNGTQSSRKPERQYRTTRSEQHACMTLYVAVQRPGTLVLLREICWTRFRDGLGTENEFMRSVIPEERREQNILLATSDKCAEHLHLQCAYRSTSTMDVKAAA